MSASYVHNLRCKLKYSNYGPTMPLFILRPSFNQNYKDFLEFCHLVYSNGNSTQIYHLAPHILLYACLERKSVLK